jgi:serine/threonine-protein kinase
MAITNGSLANAETIEAPRHSPALARGDTSDQLRNAARRKVALVEGSAPQMSAETRNVLRSRLRVVAVLLFIGFAAFLVWCVIQASTDSPAANFGALFFLHIGVMALLGLIAWKLCASCSLSLPYLRVAETLVFGVPAAFFLMMNYEVLREGATLIDHPHVPSIIGGWLLLIFCYALFVPNSWRRAAIVIGLMAAAPIAVIAYANWQVEPLAEMLRSTGYRGYVTEQVLEMCLAAMAAIVGVYSIGALRQEAFVARQLGQYRLKKLLGSGGMGEVYLAEHQMMKRPCAVKLIRPERAGDPNVLARFEREVRATAKLSHWNSIDIYDYGRTEDGTFYYVMEFLPGHNLGELVSGHGPLPAARIVYLMRQVCDALAEAHSHNLVHRDIKPANIYCAYRGGIFDVAKLLDFGLAKPLAEKRDVDLTQEGSITGSPLFMSPEQATSEEVDGRSDIYSLGAVMYFMATGRAPFNHASPLKVMIAHASDDPEPPRYVNPEVPPELEEIILRSLEKRPEDRYQTVAELREALDHVPTESDWNARLAADWWENYGCPQRKAFCAEAVELAAV